MRIAKIITCSIAAIFLTTEILTVPSAYADGDVIQAKGDALGGLDFGGGARPTSESFGGKAVPVKKLSDEKRMKSGSEEKSESPSPYAWMTPSPLTRNRDKAGAEQKLKKIEAKLDLTAQERKTGAFAPALIQKSRDAEDPDVQNIADLFSDLLKELPLKFQDEKSEEPFEESPEDIRKTQEDEDEDAQTDALLKDMMTDFSEEDFSDPAANEEKTRTFTSAMIMDEMIKKSQLPENFDDLAAAMKASDSGAEKVTASTQMDVNADVTETPEGEGYWEDVYEDQLVLDEAVLAEITALTNQIADLENQKAALQSQVDALDQQIDSLQQQIDSLNASLERMQNALDRVDQRIARIQARINAIQADIDAKTAEYRQLEAQWNQLYQQNVQLDQQARMLRMELVSVPRPTFARRREIQRELNRLTAEFRANIREMNQLRRDGLRLARQVRGLERDKRAQERQLADANRDRDRILDNMDRARQRIARLEDMKRDKEAQKQNLLNQMADLDNQINDLYARIADLMTRLYVWKRVLVGKRWVPTPSDPQSPEDPAVVDEPATDISRHLVKEITAADEVTS